MYYRTPASEDSEVVDRIGSRSFVRAQCFPFPSPFAVAMALRILAAVLALAVARGEDIEAAMAADDTCTAGKDCSLELHQLRGMKVDYVEALEDDDTEVEVKAHEQLEGGKCQNPADLKAGAALNRIGQVL